MIKVDLKGVEEVNKWLRESIAVDRTKMQNIGILMHRSIVENFNNSGRPVKWHPLAASTIEQRRHGKKSQHGTKPLMDTGTLRDSVGFTATKNSVEIGPSVDYGIFHQLGLGVPARPFIVEPTEQEYTRIEDMIMGPSHV
jgi:phage gpG-like protein